MNMAFGSIMQVGKAPEEERVRGYTVHVLHRHMVVFCMTLNFVTLSQKLMVKAIEISARDMNVRITSLFIRLSTLILLRCTLPQFLMICVSKLD